MATEKQMHELIGRAVVNHEFRAKLLTDPAQAARETGYDLTPEQVAVFKTADGSGIAEVLDERLPKSAAGQCGSCALVGFYVGLTL